MKHRIIPILGLLLLTLTVSAQKLVVDAPVIDCGKTAYKVPITATFELRNAGSKRLFIERVEPDCGCTKVSISKSELGAGEKCTIKLSYDASVLGHFEKSAMVTYRGRQADAPSYVPVSLRMKGVVLTELKDYSGIYPYAFGDLLADKNELEFDDVSKGEHPELVINVLNNGDAVMTPNIQHLPSYLSATATPLQLMPGRSGKVVVRLMSENIHDFGLTQTTVHLASQLGEKVIKETEMPVSIVLLPDLAKFDGKSRQLAPRMELSDSVIVLGMVNGKKRKKAELVITNHGRIDLDISSLQMFTAGIQLTLDKRCLMPGEQTKLKVTASLEQLKKARSKPRILMITNDPDHCKVVIPIIIK